MIARYFVIGFSVESLSVCPRNHSMMEGSPHTENRRTISNHKNAKYYKCDNKVRINYVFRYVLHE